MEGQLSTAHSSETFVSRRIEMQEKSIERSNLERDWLKRKKHTLEKEERFPS